MRVSFQFILISLLLCACVETDQSITLPSPSEKTVVKADMEETGKGEARREWIEDLHRAENGTDWRQLEYQNDMKRHEHRTDLRAGNQSRSGEEVFADGYVIGEWRERGSSNLAGSVVATTYHKEEEKIYLISAGGSLFKSSIDGLDWEVVNQDLRFSGSLLQFIEYDQEERLVAIIDRIPHFSTDRGVSWVPSTGILINDRWGNCYSPIVHNNEIFVLSKPSYWTALKIFRSEDGGATYSEIRTVSSHDQGRFQLFKIHHDEDLRLVEKVDEASSVISKYLPASNTFQVEFQMPDGYGFKDGRANMTGFRQGENLTFLFYDGEEQVIRSDDAGATWNIISRLDAAPWGVGIYISPSMPNVMLMGAVECFRSDNGGQSWRKINRWGEYYGDIVNKLHADMMYFNEMEDANGEPFLLISNHGGLNISRNGGQTVKNIGLYGLNVSQYYSVRTDPINSDYIYAGAQDQGFQRGQKSNADWVDFDQIISGDYGHICFTENGNRMWSVYPGGWVIYYGSPKTQFYPEHSYTIDSDHESVWIPPVVPHPDETKNSVFVAGGNIEGGSGAHIIQLTATPSGLEASQLPTEFRALSNDGKIGAIAFSEFDDEKFYVSTDNGYFFYSGDGGQTFSRGINKVAGSHYLYGTSILPSKLDAEVVYLGGSGYSTSPVVKSDDGGKFFKDMSEGLPPTVVFQLASNEDESLIFAATESGPFVFVSELERWYDLSGVAAPAQTYWCVEFLDRENVARFGTYGRGIWDFEVQELTTSSSDVKNAPDELKISPNPTSGEFFVDRRYVGRTYQILSMQGQIISSAILPSNGRIDLSNFTPGMYSLVIGNKSQIIIKY